MSYYYFFRTWKKATKVDDFIASVSLNDAVGPNVNFIRWAVHGDWVQQVGKHNR